MGRLTWWLIGIAIAYFLFYLGGNYSFRYTHVCAKSHKEVVYTPGPHVSTSHTVVICDRYAGNARRWSFGDPVRAVASERLIKWDGMALGGFIVLIGGTVFLERRRRKNRAHEARIMETAAPKT